jgi:chromosome partitioning protein
MAGTTGQTTNGADVIITVAQEKGGVGKTTTAKNLAAAWGARGRRVLAVDTDAQAALTRQVGLTGGELAHTIVDVLAGRVPAADAIVHGVHGFDVLPANRDLRGVELALVGEIGRETFLTRALEPLRDSYDTIVIDTPPNLGMLTVNALMPADVILAPVAADDEGAAQGLAELRGTIAKLARLRDGREPTVLAILTRWRDRRIMSDVVEAAISTLGVPVTARIPDRAIVKHASVHREPVLVRAPDCAPSIAYRRLADRLLEQKAAA